MKNNEYKLPKIKQVTGYTFDCNGIECGDCGFYKDDNSIQSCHKIHTGDSIGMSELITEQARTIYNLKKLGYVEELESEEE